jgi:hypothetical protein
MSNLKNFFTSKFLLFFIYIFFFVGLVLNVLTIYFQPLVGDDFHYKETVLISLNFIEYFKYQYFNWSGRFPKILLSYWIFSNEINLIIYKISILPIFLFTFFVFLKKIIRINLKFFSIDFIILFICLWFIYPKIDETIIWTIGSSVYLVPWLICIYYLIIFVGEDNFIEKNIFILIFYLIISFLAGGSHLQIFIGGFIISSYFILYNFFINFKKFKKLFLFYSFFLIGGISSIFAPGNFERLGVLGNETSLISTIYKAVLFVGTTIFYLGDIQSSLIYFLLIILLFYLYSSNLSLELFLNKDNFVWLLAFLFSLLCIIPAINAINPRVIFFPIIFLTIFFLKIIFLDYQKDYQIRIKKIFVLILVILFFLESFLSSLTNYIFKQEYEQRIDLIKNAKSNLNNSILVSHYTIIPSRLTHIPNPTHDKNDLNFLSKKYQLEIDYDDNFPRSKEIRKDIKFFLK